MHIHEESMTKFRWARSFSFIPLFRIETGKRTPISVSRPVVFLYIVGTIMNGRNDIIRFGIVVMIHCIKDNILSYEIIFG